MKKIKIGEDRPYGATVYVTNKTYKDMEKRFYKQIPDGDFRRCLEDDGETEYRPMIGDKGELTIYLYYPAEYDDEEDQEFIYMLPVKEIGECKYKEVPRFTV